MSFKHMKIQSLDDFFVPLSGRSEKGIYFYRFNKTSDKIDEFIYKYYNAARKSGVVIDGKIGNPAESNLSYYQEIMGRELFIAKFDKMVSTSTRSKNYKK